MEGFDEIQKEIERDRKADIFKEICLYAVFLAAFCFGAVRFCQWVMDWMIPVRFKIVGGGF